MRRSTRQRVWIAAFLSGVCVATVAVYFITNSPFDQSAATPPEAIVVPPNQHAADSAVAGSILAADAAQHDKKTVSN